MVFQTFKNCKNRRKNPFEKTNRKNQITVRNIHYLLSPLPVSLCPSLYLYLFLHSPIYLLPSYSSTYCHMDSPLLLPPQLPPPLHPLLPLPPHYHHYYYHNYPHHYHYPYHYPLTTATITPTTTTTTPTTTPSLPPLPPPLPLPLPLPPHYHHYPLTTPTITTTPSLPPSLTLRKIGLLDLSDEALREILVHAHISVSSGQRSPSEGHRPRLEVSRTFHLYTSIEVTVVP